MPRGVKLGATRGKYAIQPNNRQKTAVQGFLDGRKWAEALRLAGYSHKTTLHFSKKDFLESRGVKTLLNQLGDVAMQRFGMSLPDKIVSGYLDGIDATRVVNAGKKTRKYPDFIVRKAYLDKLCEFLGWTDSKSYQPEQHNTFNFFSGSQEERSRFNEKFKAFLKAHG